MNRREFTSGIFYTALLSSPARLAATEQQHSKLHTNKTAFFTHSMFLKHHIAPRHPESPERIKHIHQMMSSTGISSQLVNADINTDPGNWLESVHSRQHIESIRKNTPLAHEVASTGAGIVLAAVEQVIEKKADNAFCAIRPPGHHALNTGREEGFCYYNNIAIAARFAQQQYDLNRILIIDWDFHHGNATEAIFYDDPGVLFFSTHDQYAYPETGDPARKGSGKGEGYNINVHLPCGTGDEGVIDAFQSILMPAANVFQPELVLVSAGFDSRKDDPLGCFEITNEGFIALTKIAIQIAKVHCQGRLVSILEGGYNLRGNAEAVVAHVSTLLNQAGGQAMLSPGRSEYC